MCCGGAGFLAWVSSQRGASLQSHLLGGDAVLPAGRAASFLRCLPRPRCTLCHRSRGAELTFKPNLVQMRVR